MADDAITVLRRAVVDGVTKANSGYQTVGAIQPMLRQNASDNMSEAIHGSLLRGVTSAHVTFYWWIPTTGDVLTANGSSLTLCTSGSTTVTNVNVADLRMRGVREYTPGVLQSGGHGGSQSTRVLISGLPATLSPEAGASLVNLAVSAMSTRL